MIKLIALDLDGTLFDPNGSISQADQLAIREALALGVEVVIASGRPYAGLPLELMKKLNIRYAITVNGAALYTVPEKKCICENPLDTSTALTILKHLEGSRVYSDIFIDGLGYGSESKLPLLSELGLSPSLLQSKLNTRRYFRDLNVEIHRMNRPIQKITLDFIKNPDGTYCQRQEVAEYLETIPNIDVVCGGFQDLEITGKNVNKGMALLELADALGISQDEIMAVGDSGNDLSMILAAGTGVAMKNAEAEILSAADFVTKSNTESGVACAIEQLVLSQFRVQAAHN